MKKKYEEAKKKKKDMKKLRKFNIYYIEEGSDDPLTLILI